MSKIPTNVCPEHPNARLIEDARAGDIICTDCGLVVGDRVIDVSSEWRTFANDEGKDRSRVGAAQSSLLNNSDLSTVMQVPTGKNSWDIQQTSLVKNNKAGQTDTAEERYLKNGYNEIMKIAEKGHLSKIVTNRAKEIYKLVADRKVVKGTTPVAIAAACLFASCRENNVARSFKEVCAYAGITKKQISKPFNKIIKSIPEISVGNRAPEGSDMFPRYCSYLGESDARLYAIAGGIFENLNELGLADGKSTLTKAAACLYWAFYVRFNSNTESHKIKRLHQICQVIGIAEATVKNLFRTIYESDRKIDLVPAEHRAKMSETVDMQLRRIMAS